MAGDNPVYSSTNGVLFNKNQTKVIRCPQGKVGSYKVPNSVKNIGDNAFYDCSGLTFVIISGGTVTSIGNNAFFDCASLTGITIPSGVTNIGNEAFSSCRNLSYVTIPYSVINIGSNAFSLCHSLPAITVDGRNPVYSSLDGVLFNKNKTMLIVTPAGISGNYTVPSGVTNIGAEAFSACLNLTNVIIPASVVNIENKAFAYCSMVTGIYFAGNAPSLGSAVFTNTTVTVCSLPETTGWGSTFGGRPVTPPWLTVNGGAAVGPYTDVQRVKITANTSETFVRWVGAAQYVENATAPTTTVAMPAQRIALTATYSTSFTYTTNNGAITITGGVGGAATIPNAINGLPVTSIRSNAFYGCSDLTSITIPASVTSIGSSAFYGSDLASVIIGSGVTNIGAAAFSRTGLKSITIPSGVTGIGTNVFQGCSGLTNATIGNGINYIPERAFDSCNKLTSITIPAGVTGIGNYAFYYCAGLTNAIIGSSVTNIGSYAFNGCSGLTSVTILGSVSSIGDSAFESCWSLTGGLTIPAGVTNVGSYAFGFCNGLTGVTILGSVTRIGNSAFFGCSSLTAVYFQGNAPSLGGTSVFSYTTNATVYYMPGTTGWGELLGNRPTVLWNPQIQTGDISFGMQTNRFGFTVTGTTNFTVVVEGCTNLTGGVWEPVRTGTVTSGSFSFSDPQSTNYPGRFYRLRMP